MKIKWRGPFELYGTIGRRHAMKRRKRSLLQGVLIALLALICLQLAIPSALGSTVRDAFVYAEPALVGGLLGAGFSLFSQSLKRTKK